MYCIICIRLISYCRDQLYGSLKCKQNYDNDLWMLVILMSNTMNTPSQVVFIQRALFHQQCDALVQHVYIFVNHLRKWVRKAWRRLNYHSGVKLNSTRSWLMQSRWRMSISRRLGTGWHFSSILFLYLQQFLTISPKANKKLGSTFQKACHHRTSTNRFTQYLASW